VRTLPIALVLFPAHVRSLAAQWQVGIEVAATRYGARRMIHRAAMLLPTAARHTPPISARIGRNWRSVRRCAPASYANRDWPSPGKRQPDRQDNGIVRSSPSWHPVEGSGEQAVRLSWAALTCGNLDAHASRVGALGAAAYEWPVAAVLGTVRLEGVLSRSWFDPGDTRPNSSASHLALRRGLGLRYRL